MKSKRLALLLSCLILITGSACTTIEVAAPLPCPARPVLAPITVEMQIEMQPATVLIVAQNQLKLKTYTKKLEARAQCSD